LQLVRGCRNLISRVSSFETFAISGSHFNRTQRLDSDTDCTHSSHDILMESRRKLITPTLDCLWSLLTLITRRYHTFNEGKKNSLLEPDRFYYRSNTSSASVYIGITLNTHGLSTSVSGGGQSTTSTIETFCVEEFPFGCSGAEKKVQA